MLRLLFIVFCVFTSWACMATEVRFCYEDKHAPPFIHGAGQTVPSANPGVTIQIVQQLDEHVKEVSFTYTRKPWSRCLHELENGKVDAVVASHRASREGLMAYPKNPDGTVAQQYAINRISTCLLKSKTNKATLNLSKEIELAVPRGYAIRESMPKHFSIFETDSLEHAIALVENELLDATIGLCQIGNMPITLSPPFNHLEAVFPPLETSFGFMAFSEQFYQQHPELSWKVWRASQLINLDTLYSEYLRSQTTQMDKQ
ncbi:amino acid ABC transporter substrate-binding protein [Pseudoalteromonas flavipulchra]|nr:amino acid ABC transporter substrate-binding protein [Pseudoalteromonas flavipulchra NCIMB 2033 = ATCC BAA-314]MBD0783529.1 amino acid ABC transporter substrate-binding protein [Pseudoalteromonas flavipulchra]MBE0375165.1 polar amino acid transport system substrate-binding protein [Pseudoalteromonas flavipulchra NCIMB 2033 = ATCC BAA-314]RZG13063.1 amino acid ABC transporter substrate-binding protein [Pseudoalteromonas sp. CO342X]